MVLGFYSLNFVGKMDLEMLMQAGQNLYLTTDYTDYGEIFAFEKRYGLGRINMVINKIVNDAGLRLK